MSDGHRIELDGLTISFHRIGTERFDLWMARSALAKLWRRADLEDWLAAGRFLVTHLFGEGFAVALELHASGRTIVFFGNLTTNAGRIAERLPEPDVAVLPYCPANGDWIAETLALARALRPRRVLVHHFDQFMPPVTVGLDMPAYIRYVSSQTDVEKVVLPKFYRETTLDAVTGGAAALQDPF